MRNGSTCEEKRKSCRFYISDLVEDGQWAAKTKERQLVREKGTLLKEVRELHHSTSVFNRAKIEDAKEHFNELQQKINFLSKLHSGSYQLSKRNTINRIESNRKRLQQTREDGRKHKMSLTTTEKRYQSILNTMDQIVVEADDLALQFEKQLREKARRHHELGNELKELGAQLRLEQAKKDKFIKEEEKQKREEALERLSQWRDSEVADQTLKVQLQIHEKKFLDKTRGLGKELRNMDHAVKLKQREYGRKLQDVNCLLGKVGEEQRRLSENKIHIENQGTIGKNEQNVEDHISRQKSILAQRQTKANKWEPKLRQLAKENEQRLNEMERQILFEDVAKAGGKERTLYRNMRKLESETRKQEQICNSKKALMETVSNSARKEAQDQLRAVNSHQKELGEQVLKEEALLRKLIVQRDNALAEYRQHQTGLKDIIQLFQTLSSEQERKTKLSES
ncbi:hypothetical protein ACHWQZ_G014390 [Mnemiopsis leidyi]